MPSHTTQTNPTTTAITVTTMMAALIPSQPLISHRRHRGVSIHARSSSDWCTEHRVSGIH